MPRPYVPRSRVISRGEVYNGDASLTSLPTNPAHILVNAPETFLVYLKWGTTTSSPAYIFCNCASNANDGVRIIIEVANGNLPGIYYRNSSGTDVRGARINQGAVAGNSYHYAFTLTGVQGQSGQSPCYSGVNGAPLEDLTTTALTISNFADGTNSYPIVIGNRVSSTARFSGSSALYYVARWNRVLSLGELLLAQEQGPKAVPEGLILLWSDGKDHGPYGMQPTTYAPSAFSDPGLNRKLGGRC